MNPPRWRQIESLYNQAVEMDEGHRTAFLRDACGGDDVLRHEIEELIAEGGQVASFLEKAAIGEIATEFAAETAPSHQSWIGRQIGNYEFVSLAGAGGMGEVYRARDRKLKRDVVIKILPGKFARDPDRISRFQREAELLASLNHPNIAAIYDLEEADGDRFLILELVEGETLADQIKRGPIAVEEALKIALQIAEALEAAHNKNVIHRDLKPANIKVTAGGKVKVLDFGLAKALLDDVSLSNSPTVSMTATQQGVILGTAAYMSPEQARGQAVDKRADVWAFGCVLFEMLSGRGLFGGKTVTDILASVLKTAPDWDSLPANLHPRILHLLERCLEKESQDRCQGLADARVEIKKVLADSGDALTRPSTEARPRLRSRLPWIAAITGAAVIASILVWIFKPTEPAQSQRFPPFFPPEGQIFSIRRTSFLAISRDGSRIAYLGDDGINLGDIKALDPKPIPGSKGALGHPLFSPDGQSLVYIGPSQLMKIPVGGGNAIPLIKGPPMRPTVGASWTKDDRILFASTAGILEIPATGGTPKVIIKAAEGETLGSPELLPDGKSLLFSATTAPEGIDRWESARILVLLKSGERKVIWNGGGDPHYIPTGHIVYAQGNRLSALPFDIDTLKPVGPPVSFAKDLVRSEGGATDTGNYDISDTGTLVYMEKPATTYPDGILAIISRDGHQEKLNNVQPQQYRSVRVSPDELHLAVDVQGKDEKSSIWIYDLKDSVMRPLTPAGHNYIRPIWRDNKTVTYGSDSDGTWRIYSQRADGSAMPVPLTTGDSRSIQQFPESWSPDGRTLSFVKTRNASKVASEDWGIWTYSMDTQTANLFNDSPDANDYGSVFSPDGRWLTYNSYPRTLAQTFPATGLIKPLAVSPLGSLVWSKENEVIYRQDLQGKVQWTAAAVDYSTKGTFEIRDRLPLPFPDSQTFQNYRSWDIALNGQKLVAIVPAAASPAPPTARARITIVLNWFEELKALAPPR